MRQNLDNMRDGILRTGLQHLITDLPSNLIMVEVGCFKGESTEMFLKSGKINKLYAVDTWANARYRMAEQLFKRRFANYHSKLVVLKMTMEEAIKRLPLVDFVYIDADHTYDWVKADILNALKVLKPESIIAGHDYLHKGNVGVIEAVHDVLGQPDIIYEDTSWVKYII